MTTAPCTGTYRLTTSFCKTSDLRLPSDLGAARRAILDTSHKHTAVLKVNYAPIEQMPMPRTCRKALGRTCTPLPP